MGDGVGVTFFFLVFLSCFLLLLLLLFFCIMVLLLFFFCCCFCCPSCILPLQKAVPAVQAHCMRSGCSCWGWYCTKAVAGAAGVLAVMGGCTAPV